MMSLPVMDNTTSLDSTHPSLSSTTHSTVPPPIQQAGGTHPTGMLSSLVFVFAWDRKATLCTETKPDTLECSICSL